MTRSARDFLHQLGVALPEELLVQTWSVPAAVFAALDDDALLLAGPRAFAFLQSVWQHTGQPGTLLSLCSRPWRSRRRGAYGS